MQNEQDDIRALSNRAERLISALTEALMTAAEVAAERISLASKVVSLEQRMRAYSTVLDIIDAQRGPVLNALKNARGARRLQLEKQLQMLEEQEVEVLSKTGMSKEEAHTLIVAERKLCDRK